MKSYCGTLVNTVFICVELNYATSRIAFNSSYLKESQDLKYREQTRDEKRNGVKC